MGKRAHRAAGRDLAKRPLSLAVRLAGGEAFRKRREAEDSVSGSPSCGRAVGCAPVPTALPGEEPTPHPWQLEQDPPEQPPQPEPLELVVGGGASEPEREPCIAKVDICRFTSSVPHFGQLTRSVCERTSSSNRIAQASHRYS